MRSGQFSGRARTEPRRRGRSSLERAPIGEIAQIFSGVDRKSCRHARSPRGDQQRHLRCPRAKGRGSASTDRERRVRPIDVGKERRPPVSCAYLDPKVGRARCEPEHQYDVGSVPRDQCRELASDRRIARREHVRDPPDRAERRPPPARQAFGKRRSRIDRRAGKRAKPGDEHNLRHSQSHGLRDLVDRERWRQPSLGNCGFERGQARADPRIGLEPGEQPVVQHGPHPFDLLLAPTLRQLA